jgi:APA family basic amino acid/polyamine antiporter
MPNHERPYKVFGYPILPVVYIFLAVSVSAILLLYKPLYTWPGLIIVLIGIPIYFIRSKR